jgi:hypothetical protein
MNGLGEMRSCRWWRCWGNRCTLAKISRHLHLYRAKTDESDSQACYILDSDIHENRYYHLSTSYDPTALYMSDSRWTRNIQAMDPGTPDFPSFIR